jgi:hypothetical protein
MHTPVNEDIPCARIEPGEKKKTMAVTAEETKNMTDEYNEELNAAAAAAGERSISVYVCVCVPEL